MDPLTVATPGGEAVVSGADAHLGRAIAHALHDAGLVVLDEETDPTRTVDVAVYARAGAEALRPCRLVDVDEARWQRCCDQLLRDFVQWLQRIHDRVAPRRGTVVLVAPTASQEGAAGLVPYTTAVEGQRLLAKSVARQWAPDGITVLVVAPRLDALVADPHTLDGTDALRTEPVLPAHDAETVARVVSLIVHPAARAMSGATFMVDGGALMAP